MDREPLLLSCVPALLTASALAVGAANADDQNAHEERAAQKLRDALPDRMASSRARTTTQQRSTGE